MILLVMRSGPGALFFFKYLTIFVISSSVILYLLECQLGGICRKGFRRNWLFLSVLVTSLLNFLFLFGESLKRFVMVLVKVSTFSSVVSMEMTFPFWSVDFNEG